MSNKKNIQHVWAATDKPLIDRMRAPTALNHDSFTSSEDSSDSDLDSVSEASFLAVPREFRPNSSIKQFPLVNKKINKDSLTNQTYPLLSISPQNTRNGFTDDQSSSIPSPAKYFIKNGNTTIMQEATSEETSKATKHNQTQLKLSAGDQNYPNPPSTTFSRIEQESALFKPKEFSTRWEVLPNKNSMLNRSENMLAQKSGVSGKVVIPGNERKPLQISDKTEIIRDYRDNQQFKDKTLMVTNLLSNCDQKVSFTEMPKKNNNENIIEFECIHVSEQAKVSKNKTIEFDVTNLTLDVKTSRIITDSSKIQKVSDNPKSSLNKKNNNFPKHSYNNDYSQSKQPNMPPNAKSVTWHNTRSSSNSKQSSRALNTKIEIENNSSVKWLDATKLNNSNQSCAQNSISANKKYGSVKWHSNQSSDNLKQSLNTGMSEVASKTDASVQWCDAENINNSKQFSAKVPISANQTELFSGNSNRTVKWTVTNQRKTCFSAKRLSFDDVADEHKESILYQSIDRYEIEDLNSSPKFSDKRDPSKIKYCIKDNDQIPGIQNYKVHNTHSKEHRKYNCWEGKDYLENDSSKDNLNRNNDLRTDKIVSNNDTVPLHLEQIDSNYSTYPENIESINIFGGCYSKVSKQSQNINTVNLGTLNEQFNFSSKNLSHQVTLPKKAMKEDIKPSLEHNLLIEFGKEISDLIIGSHTALSTLFSIYGEWRQLRCQLIEQFKQLEKAIIESSKKYKMYRDMFEVGNGIAKVATSIPHPYVTIAARVVCILTSLASKLFKTPNNVDVDEPEITRLLIKDVFNSSELYMHGLQCNLQFEETRKLIEKFHSKATISEFTDIECKDISNFVRGVLEYRPQHRIFYKKLHKCFQELLQNGTSLYSRQFCEPFTLYSANSVDVVGYLDWRFVEVNNDSVERKLKEVLYVIQDSNSSTRMTDLASRINDCNRILSDELESVMKCVAAVPIFEV